MKKKSSLQYDQILETAFQFDQASIAANADGKLSERQRSFLETEARNSLVITLLLIVISFALLFWAVIQPSEIIAIAIGLIFSIGFVPYFALHAYKRYQTLKHDTVESVEGPVELGVQGTSNSTGYSVTIGNVYFSVKQPQFLAFKNGDPYRLYYLPKNMRLLSVEWLVADRDDEDESITEDAEFDRSALSEQDEKRLRG